MATPRLANLDHGERVILITRDGERLISALETIARAMNSQERIEHLESLLRNFVRLMLKPDASNEEWDSLLDRVQETLP
jgi:hypothetical protein